MVKIITRYDYEAQKAIAPGTTFDKKNANDRSMTNQADMDAADVNKIMARYEKTGVLVDASGNERQPMYGDFTEIKDYYTSKCAIANVERAFLTLPASVRNRFENNPQLLIDFLEDPKNDTEAVKLGLKDREVLLTALADDGVTRITAEERAVLDQEKKEAAARAAKGAPADKPGAGASGSGTGA